MRVGNAGIVDKAVDAAKPVNRALHGDGDILFVGNITGEKQASGPGFIVECGHDFMPGFFITIKHHDFPPGLQKVLGDAKAKSLCATGDKRNFVVGVINHDGPLSGVRGYAGSGHVITGLRWAHAQGPKKIRPERF